jgi:hypothetical protein
MSRRLCEVKDEIFPAAMELVRRDHDFYVRMSLDELRCPHAGHCDKSKPKCDGMTPENLVKIEQIEDKLFSKGYYRRG